MDNKVIHKNLANGKWLTLSLAQQMGNIGSEVSRASRQQGKDEKLFWGSVERAMELFNLTLSDKRWTSRLRELGRAREVFADAVLGSREYGTNFQDLQKYFDQFAMLTMANRSQISLK